MPTYDYYCSTNDKTVEVSHPMKEKISSWGELCRQANIEPDGTPIDSPVERLISGGTFIGTNANNDATPEIPAGSCGGGCGFN